MRGRIERIECEREKEEREERERERERGHTVAERGEKERKGARDQNVCIMQVRPLVEWQPRLWAELLKAGLRACHLRTKGCWENLALRCKIGTSFCTTPVPALC